MSPIPTAAVTLGQTSPDKTHRNKTSPDKTRDRTSHNKIRPDKTSRNKALRMTADAALLTARLEAL